MAPSSAKRSEIMLPKSPTKAIILNSTLSSIYRFQPVTIFARIQVPMKAPLALTSQARSMVKIRRSTIPITIGNGKGTLYGSSFLFPTFLRTQSRNNLAETAVTRAPKTSETDKPRMAFQHALSNTFRQTSFPKLEELPSIVRAQVRSNLYLFRCSNLYT